jgi:hypothetical protein
VCGNGIKESGEQCDDGLGNGTDGCCTLSCTLVSDTDGDGVCNQDDNCPNDANANQDDLDGDDIGDVCDDSDAVVQITRARARSSDGTPGNIIVEGIFQLASIGDTFDSTQGIEVEVQDGMNLDEVFTWTPDECTQANSGYINCKSPDRTVLAVFTPRDPNSYIFTLRFTQIPSLSGPFAPPMSVHIASNPGELVTGIDRTGSISTCEVTSLAIQCIAP